MVQLPDLSPLPELAPDDVVARAVTLRPIEEVAGRIGLPAGAVVPHGRHKAKIELDAVARRRRERPAGKLVLVTGMTATRAGDGKTVTSVSLAQGLAHLGRSVCLALREPSLGPTFGIKGGAAGGGLAQVLPMDEINLHFTGDLHAITAANNLLAALVDNHVHYQERELASGARERATSDVDPDRITWRRVLDSCDRQLRNCQFGGGRPADGFPHAGGFDITAASEVMAVLALSRDRADLRDRLGRMIVAQRRDGRPLRASELEAVGALEVLLRDALLPNLVQTTEGVPAVLHCGPFANIAHGCNSLLATELALHSADYAVTEAGFAADLGAEKFLDIKCRQLGTFPAAAVLVVTCRALKLHGGADPATLATPDPAAVERGFVNAAAHLDNLRHVFGLPVVVAINRFGHDTRAELERVASLVDAEGARWAISEGFARGGVGAASLAEAVVEATEGGNRPLRPCYELSQSLPEKVEVLTRRVYGGDGVDWSEEAFADLAGVEASGGGELPVCVAKTQHSLSDDPTLKGAPRGFRLRVSGLRLSAGAGFVVVRTGDVVLMPGMPERTGAHRIGLDEAGNVVGLS